MIKKFRIWNLDTKQWENPEDFAINLSTGEVLSFDWHGDSGKTWSSPWTDNYKTQQWTGLTDSQGVEIYEGDIVSAIYPEYKTAKVFFCVNSGSFRLLSGNVTLPMVTMRTQGGQSPKLINVFEKVIGNIFQTPELLEKCSA